jgi:hypothetical protein
MGAQRLAARRHRPSDWRCHVVSCMLSVLLYCVCDIAVMLHAVSLRLSIALRCSSRLVNTRPAEEVDLKGVGTYPPSFGAHVARRCVMWSGFCTYIYHVDAIYRPLVIHDRAAVVRRCRLVVDFPTDALAVRQLRFGRRGDDAVGSPLPHLHRDWAHGCPICTRTGLTPATSAPGLGSPLPHLHKDWAHPGHICTGTGLTPATSAPGLGSPLLHLHRDWAHGCHICTGTGLARLSSVGTDARARAVVRGR